MTGEITALLQRLTSGDREAWHQLAPLVYDEIKRQAKSQVRGERPDALLQTTAVVHEALLRLMGESDRNWANRGHFYRVCAQVIRRVLVDSARRRKALRRGGGAENEQIQSLNVPAPQTPDWEDLERALVSLESIAPRQARVVELRYFSGLSLEETAQVLAINAKTVQRDWLAARAWLFRELQQGSA